MISVSAETFPLARKFTISRGSKTEAQVVTARITRNGITGWGEAVPYARYGETVPGVMAQIAAQAPWITREELARDMPAGAARNALDCALWDLEAKTARVRVWDLAGLPAPRRGCVKTPIYAMLPYGWEALHGRFHRGCQPGSDDAFPRAVG